MLCRKFHENQTILSKVIVQTDGRIHWLILQCTHFYFLSTQKEHKHTCISSALKMGKIDREALSFAIKNARRSCIYSRDVFINEWLLRICNLLSITFVALYNCTVLRYNFNASSTVENDPSRKMKIIGNLCGENYTGFSNKRDRPLNWNKTKCIRDIVEIFVSCQSIFNGIIHGKQHRSNGRHGFVL